MAGTARQTAHPLVGDPAGENVSQEVSRSNALVDADNCEAGLMSGLCDGMDGRMKRLVAGVFRMPGNGKAGNANSRVVMRTG